MVIKITFTVFEVSLACVVSDKATRHTKHAQGENECQHLLIMSNLVSFGS